MSFAFWHFIKVINLVIICLSLYSRFRNAYCVLIIFFLLYKIVVFDITYDYNRMSNAYMLFLRIYVTRQNFRFDLKYSFEIKSIIFVSMLI